MPVRDGGVRRAHGSLAKPRIAYVMSRFPKITETFVLHEILALERKGIEVLVFPLLRQREPVVHPDAERLARRAHYLPFLSPAIVASNLRMLASRPRTYLGALIGMVRAALGSPWFLLGGLAIFPKVVHQARRMEAAGVGHVHCHFANHPATAGYVISRLTGIPYSFTAHGSDLHRDRHMLREKVSRARLVVAISRYNRERIVEAADPRDARKIRVIHCGVDPARFRPREAEPHDTTGERRLELLCVASFQEVKGQEYLLRAVARLRDRGVRSRLRLIGDGPRRELLEGVIREHGLGQDVELLGARPTHEVAAAVGETDVFVLPSVLTRKGDREGIPVALMEAMAAGVPVVASRLSGIPELVRDGETGLLVAPRDVDGIADAIARLHGDPELRARLARGGRDMVRREFDLHANAAELAALLTGASVPAGVSR